VDRIVARGVAQKGLADELGHVRHDFDAALVAVIHIPGGNRILTAADAHAGLLRLVGREHIVEKPPKGSGKFILSNAVT
jgi:hypothetical protein